MTDSRVDDSTPCDTKLTPSGALSQPIEFDDIVQNIVNPSLNSTDSTLKVVVLTPALHTSPTLIDVQTQFDLPVLPSVALSPADHDAIISPIPLIGQISSQTAQSISQLAAQLARTSKSNSLELSTSLNARTPAVLNPCSSDQGIVYEWDFWRPHAQYLSDTLERPDALIPRYQQSLLDSCGLVGAVLAHYDLLHVSEVTLYAFSALVDDEVQYRYQPEQHPQQSPSQPLQQNLYYPSYEIEGLNPLAPLLAEYFSAQILPTELEFAGQGDIIGVGRFDNPFSFSYEVFESFERIRIQTRSTAWLTCDLNAMPQMALYAANGWRLEQAMTDLVYFLGQQGFGLEQNQREKIAFSQALLDMQATATRYAEWDGDYLLNRSTLEPAGDQLLDVVKLFNLQVDYAEVVD
jgi:hypothetical protein